MEIFSKVISSPQILNKSVLKKHHLGNGGSAISHICMINFFRSNILPWKTFKVVPLETLWSKSLYYLPLEYFVVDVTSGISLRDVKLIS